MSGAGVHNVTDLAPVIEDLEALQEDVNAIRAVTDAEPVLEETGGTLTTDGTEQTIYTNNAPASIFKPVSVAIDFTAQTITETVVVRVYYRIVGGAGLILQDQVTFAAAQDPDLKIIDLQDLPSRYGVQVTIEKTVGTNRAYPWTASYEVH